MRAIVFVQNPVPFRRAVVFEKHGDVLTALSLADGFLNPWLRV